MHECGCLHTHFARAKCNSSWRESLCLINVMDEKSEKSPTLGKPANRKCPTLGTSKLVNARQMFRGQGSEGDRYAWIIPTYEILYDLQNHVHSTSTTGY